MDKLEKVERLRASADVTYEEAKAALDAAGDDLLEAMILLEKQGKTRSPKQSTYSTQYEQQEEYARVQDIVEETEKQSAASSLGHTIGKLIRNVFRLLRDTSLRISRKGSTILQLPTWLAVILVFFVWEGALPIVIISLFFGIRYHLEGRDSDTRTAANDILDKAADLADNVGQELTKEKDSK